MAFTGSAQIVQQTNLSNLLFTDNSTGGTDPNLTDRQILLTRVDGTTLVPSGVSTTYIDWPIIAGIGDTLNINVLPKDYSLNITVNWFSSSPISGATYTFSAVFTFTGYSNSALYKLIQDVSAQPSKLNDTNYYSNLGKAFTALDSANQAQVYSDQFAAQQNLDRLYNLVTNQNLYF
jgi:hypothetical protein